MNGYRWPPSPAPRNCQERGSIWTAAAANLLDISRLRFGRLALKKQPTALSLVVDQALETARPLLARRRHELRTRLPETPVTLCVDPSRMSQVLSNLLVNAAKYTDEGGHIELSARTD